VTREAEAVNAKADVTAMHEWWCSSNPESKMCTVLEFQRGDSKLEAAPPKPDAAEMDRMHEHWCTHSEVSHPLSLVAREASFPCKTTFTNKRMARQIKATKVEKLPAKREALEMWGGGGSDVDEPGQAAKRKVAEVWGGGGSDVNEPVPIAA